MFMVVTRILGYLFPRFSNFLKVQLIFSCSPIMPRTVPTFRDINVSFFQDPSIQPIPTMKFQIRNPYQSSIS